MGNTDSFPVASQTKSLFQLVCGDTVGAKKTCENFFKGCPGVSQMTSAVQLFLSDGKGAVETQRRCGLGLLDMADGIPLVGHVKGLLHYATGGTEGGNQAMKKATRTCAVLAGSYAGLQAMFKLWSDTSFSLNVFQLLGTIRKVAILGATFGGITGGLVADAVITAMDTSISKEYRPTGYLAALESMKGELPPGDIFDLAAIPAADGLHFMLLVLLFYAANTTYRAPKYLFGFNPFK